MAELTVASFNTHWGVDMRGRPFDVTAAGIALDADVLVLQECWRPHGGAGYVDRIAAATGASTHEVVFMSDANPARPRYLHVPPGDPGTCGLAVLSRLPVAALEVVDLPRARADVVDVRQSIVLTVEVDGNRVVVAGIHASHRLWGSLPQLRALDDVVRGTGGASVLAGDCNLWGPPIRMVLRGRRAAVRGRTWPARRPHSQIDHIWIDDRLDVVDAGVGPAVGSDHRPVRARLRLR